MIRGIDFCFYRNSAALGAGWATPTWNLVDGIKDLNEDDQFDAFENTIRRNRGLKTFLPTLEDLSIEFDLVIPDNVLQGTTTAVSAGNPDFDDFRAFQTAKRKRLPIDCLVLTGPLDQNGAEGFRAFMHVLGFGRPQSNGDGAFCKVKMQPGLPDAATLATSPAAQASLEVRVTAAALTYSLWGADTFTYTPT